MTVFTAVFNGAAFNATAFDGAVSGAVAVTTPVYIDPDAGTLIVTAADTSPLSEIDPDAGSLIVV